MRGSSNCNRNHIFRGFHGISGYYKCLSTDFTEFADTATAKTLGGLPLQRRAEVAVPPKVFLL